MTMKVAFVGLGTMGQPMAKNVAKKGHALSVFNRTPEKAMPLKEAGAAMAASPKEAAKGADVVILMLTGPEAVDQVLDGPQGVLAGLDAGKTIVDMSTVPPSYSRHLSERLKSRSIAAIDAPVYGSKKPAEEGALVILAGGPQAKVKEMEPLLLSMGKKVVYCGATGQGSMMKMFINLLLGVMVEGFAEALNFGKLGGLDMDAMLETAFSGAMNSPMFQVKAPLIKENNYPAAFPLKHLAKDCKFVVDTAFELGAPVPVGQVLLQLYRLGWAKGWGDQDISAIARVLEHLNPKA